MMKKYLLITALCAANFAYADGFENLKNLQNQFHLLIYNAGDLGAATPAPEVPYIAGLLTNPVQTIGTGEERHIYEFLYDQPSGGNRKAIPGIDQAKANAFNTINFTNFQRYRSYQDSGHSVFGIAAQEQLPPIEKVTIMSAVPRASPIVVNSSSSSSNAPTGPGLFAGGGGSFELPKLRRATTNASSTSVSATAPKSLLERVREHKKTLRNQVDIELLTELEAELSLGASEASPASDRYNDLVKFFNLLTTPAFEVVTQQIALEKNINSLRQKLKPSGASIIAAASNDATPENVQIAIDSRRYDNNLLSELLERLQRLHLNNTLYQQYRFEKLKLWFKNKDKPIVVNSILTALSIIDPSIDSVTIEEVNKTINEILPSKIASLQHEIETSTKNIELLEGDTKRHAEEAKKTVENKLRTVQTIDLPILQELYQQLQHSTVIPDRLQNLKEFLRVFNGHKSFEPLLAEIRKYLLQQELGQQFENRTYDNGQLQNLMEKLGIFDKTLPVDNNFNYLKMSGKKKNPSSLSLKENDQNAPEILQLKKEITAIKKLIDKAYDDSEEDLRAQLNTQLKDKVEQLAILGSLDGIKEIEGLDEEFFDDRDKEKIFSKIITELSGLSEKNTEQLRVLDRLRGMQGVRKVSAAPVRPSPLDGNAGGGGVQLKPTIPPSGNRSTTSDINDQKISSAELHDSAVNPIVAATTTTTNQIPKNADEVKAYLTQHLEKLNARDYGGGSDYQKIAYLEGLLRELEIIESKIVSGGEIKIPLKDGQTVSKNKSAMRDLINTALGKLRDGR